MHSLFPLDFLADVKHQYNEAEKFYKEAIGITIIIIVIIIIHMIKVNIYIIFISNRM